MITVKLQKVWVESKFLRMKVSFLLIHISHSRLKQFRYQKSIVEAFMNVDLIQKPLSKILLYKNWLINSTNKLKRYKL